MKDKYEYLLHTWGGFYNDEHQVKHGKEEGYFFFDTMAELQDYLKDLRKIEDDLNANHLAIVINEGTHVRYKTTAKMVFRYKGNEYPYEYDFGYAYSKHTAYFMFHEGNYGCDCNRSTFIRRDVDNNFPELNCGDEIKVKKFKVLQIKDENTT